MIFHYDASIISDVQAQDLVINAQQKDFPDQNTNNHKISFDFDNHNLDSETKSSQPILYYKKQQKKQVIFDIKSAKNNFYDNIQFLENVAHKIVLINDYNRQTIIPKLESNLLNNPSLTDDNSYKIEFINNLNTDKIINKTIATEEINNINNHFLLLAKNTKKTEKWDNKLEIKEDKYQPIDTVINKDILSPKSLIAQIQKTDKDSSSSQTFPTVNILTPQSNEILTGISSSVILQYPQGATVELKVNGKLVNSSLIGRTETNTKTKMVVQTWYGVVFSSGENTLSAIATLNGVKSELTSIIINVPGAASQIQISTLETRIPADGRSTATVTGKLLDENNNQSNYDAVITLNTSAGKFIGIDQNPDIEGFQIKAENGQFQATLRAGLNPETVRIRAKSLTLEAFTQIQFDTNLRNKPIFTGFVDLRIGKKGSNYYGRFRDFLSLGGDDNWEFDFTSAAFIRGSIGEWQYTGAFNSDRNLNRDDRLFGGLKNSDNLNLYPVYGDSSTSEYLTPSTDQVYFKIERSPQIIGSDPDYFMWGDYNTGEFSTASQKFSSITRNLHGFKGNYNLGNIQITAFYSNNVEGFQRDTIAPDGTSGYYFLSRRLVRAGSEDIFIELEDLNRPGTVLERQKLFKRTDYDIDYDRGTILFTKPILRTDIDEFGNVLVRRIVVTYQYENSNDETDIIAGRVRYHFNRELGQESGIGATYLNEDKGDHDFELYGLDAFISLGENDYAIAEYAHSSNLSEFNGEVSGEAYRFEIEGEIMDQVLARGYYTHADTGFSNNATVSFVPGQTRYGAEIQAEITKTTSFIFSYDHEENKGVAPRALNTLEEFLDPLIEPILGTEVDNSLDTIRLGVQQLIGKGQLNVDWVFRSREDRKSPNSLKSNSSQISSYFSYPITDRLTFKALNEFSFGNADPIYSDRTALGLSWEAFPGISLNLSQTWYTKGRFAGKSITNFGIDGQHEYALFKDTIITGRYGLTGGLNNLNAYGAIGLRQGITLAPGLRMNLGRVIN